MEAVSFFSSIAESGISLAARAVASTIGFIASIFEAFMSVLRFAFANPIVFAVLLGAFVISVPWFQHHHHVLQGAQIAYTDVIRPVVRGAVIPAAELAERPYRAIATLANAIRTVPTKFALDMVWSTAWCTNTLDVVRTVVHSIPSLARVVAILADLIGDALAGRESPITDPQIGSTIFLDVVTNVTASLAGFSGCYCSPVGYLFDAIAVVSADDHAHCALSNFVGWVQAVAAMWVRLLVRALGWITQFIKWAACVLRHGTNCSDLFPSGTDTIAVLPNTTGIARHVQAFACCFSGLVDDITDAVISMIEWALVKSGTFPNGSPLRGRHLYIGLAGRAIAVPVVETLLFVYRAAVDTLAGLITGEPFNYSDLDRTRLFDAYERMCMDGSQAAHELGPLLNRMATGAFSTYAMSMIPPLAGFGYPISFVYGVHFANQTCLALVRLVENVVRIPLEVRSYDDYVDGHYLDCFLKTMRDVGDAAAEGAGDLLGSLPNWRTCDADVDTDYVCVPVIDACMPKVSCPGQGQFRPAGGDGLAAPVRVATAVGTYAYQLSRHLHSFTEFRNVTSDCVFDELSRMSNGLTTLAEDTIAIMPTSINDIVPLINLGKTVTTPFVNPFSHSTAESISEAIDGVLDKLRAVRVFGLDLFDLRFVDEDGELRPLTWLDVVIPALAVNSLPSFANASAQMLIEMGRFGANTFQTGDFSHWKFDIGNLGRLLEAQLVFANHTASSVTWTMCIAQGFARAQNWIGNDTVPCPLWHIRVDAVNFSYCVPDALPCPRNTLAAAMRALVRLTEAVPRVILHPKDDFIVDLLDPIMCELETATAELEKDFTGWKLSLDLPYWETHFGIDPPGVIAHMAFSAIKLLNVGNSFISETLHHWVDGRVVVDIAGNCTVDRPLLSSPVGNELATCVPCHEVVAVGAPCQIPGRSATRSKCTATGECSLWSRGFTPRVSNDANQALGAAVTLFETILEPAGVVDPELMAFTESISRVPLTAFKAVLDIGLSRLPASDDPPGLGGKPYREGTSEIACTFDAMLITAGHFTSIPIALIGRTVHVIATAVGGNDPQNSATRFGDTAQGSALRLAKAIRAAIFAYGGLASAVGHLGMRSMGATMDAVAGGGSISFTGWIELIGDGLCEFDRRISALPSATNELLQSLDVTGSGTFCEIGQLAEAMMGVPVVLVRQAIGVIGAISGSKKLQHGVRPLDLIAAMRQAARKFSNALSGVMYRVLSIVVRDSEDRKRMHEVFNIMGAIAGTVLNFPIAILEVVFQAFGRLIQTVEYGNIFSKVLPICGLSDDMYDIIRPIFKALAAFLYSVSRLAGLIWQFLGDIINFVAGLIDKLLVSPDSPVAQLIGALLKFIFALIRVIVSVVNPGGTGDAIDEFVSAFLDLLAKLWNAMVRLISATIDDVVFGGLKIGKYGVTQCVLRFFDCISGIFMSIFGLRAEGGAVDPFSAYHVDVVMKAALSFPERSACRETISDVARGIERYIKERDEGTTPIDADQTDEWEPYRDEDQAHAVFDDFTAADRTRAFICIREYLLTVKRAGRDIGIPVDEYDQGDEYAASSFAEDGEWTNGPQSAPTSERELRELQQRAVSRRRMGMDAAGNVVASACESGSITDDLCLLEFVEKMTTRAERAVRVELQGLFNRGVRARQTARGEHDGGGGATVVDDAAPGAQTGQTAAESDAGWTLYDVLVTDVGRRTTFDDVIAATEDLLAEGMGDRDKAKTVMESARFVARDVVHGIGDVAERSARRDAEEVARASRQEPGKQRESDKSKRKTAAEARERAAASRGSCVADVIADGGFSLGYYYPMSLAIFPPWGQCGPNATVTESSNGTCGWNETISGWHVYGEVNPYEPDGGCGTGCPNCFLAENTVSVPSPCPAERCPGLAQEFPVLYGMCARLCETPLVLQLHAMVCQTMQVWGSVDDPSSFQTEFWQIRSTDEIRERAALALIEHEGDDLIDRDIDIIFDPDYEYDVRNGSSTITKNGPKTASDTCTDVGRYGRVSAQFCSSKCDYTNPSSVIARYYSGEFELGYEAYALLYYMCGNFCRAYEPGCRMPQRVVSCPLSGVSMATCAQTCDMTWDGTMSQIYTVDTCRAMTLECYALPTASPVGRTCTCPASWAEGIGNQTGRECHCRYELSGAVNSGQRRELNVVRFICPWTARNGIYTFFDKFNFTAISIAERPSLKNIVSGFISQLFVDIPVLSPEDHTVLYTIRPTVTGLLSKPSRCPERNITSCGFTTLSNELFEAHGRSMQCASNPSAVCVTVTRCRTRTFQNVSAFGPLPTPVSMSMPMCFEWYANITGDIGNYTPDDCIDTGTAGRCDRASCDHTATFDNPSPPGTCIPELHCQRGVFCPTRQNCSATAPGKMRWCTDSYTWDFYGNDYTVVTEPPVTVEVCYDEVVCESTPWSVTASVFAVPDPATEHSCFAFGNSPGTQVDPLRGLPTYDRDGRPPPLSATTNITCIQQRACGEHTVVCAYQWGCPSVAGCWGAPLCPACPYALCYPNPLAPGCPTACASCGFIRACGEVDSCLFTSGPKPASLSAFSDAGCTYSATGAGMTVPVTNVSCDRVVDIAAGCSPDPAIPDGHTYIKIPLDSPVPQPWNFTSLAPTSCDNPYVHTGDFCTYLCDTSTDSGGGAGEPDCVIAFAGDGLDCTALRNGSASLPTTRGPAAARATLCALMPSFPRISRSIFPVSGSGHPYPESTIKPTSVDPLMQAHACPSFTGEWGANAPAILPAGNFGWEDEDPRLEVEEFSCTMVFAGQPASASFVYEELPSSDCDLLRAYLVDTYLSQYDAAAMQWGRRHSQRIVSEEDTLDILQTLPWSPDAIPIYVTAGGFVGANDATWLPSVSTRSAPSPRATRGTQRADQNLDEHERRRSAVHTEGHMTCDASGVCTTHDAGAPSSRARPTFVLPPGKHTARGTADETSGDRDDDDDDDDVGARKDPDTCEDPSEPCTPTDCSLPRVHPEVCKRVIDPQPAPSRCNPDELVCAISILGACEYHLLAYQYVPTDPLAEFERRNVTRANLSDVLLRIRSDRLGTTRASRALRRSIERAAAAAAAARQDPEQPPEQPQQQQQHGEPVALVDIMQYAALRLDAAACQVAPGSYPCRRLDRQADAQLRGRADDPRPRWSSIKTPRRSIARAFAQETLDIMRTPAYGSVEWECYLVCGYDFWSLLERACIWNVFDPDGAVGDAVLMLEDGLDAICGAFRLGDGSHHTLSEPLWLPDPSRFHVRFPSVPWGSWGDELEIVRRIKSILVGSFQKIFGLVPSSLSADGAQLAMLGGILGFKNESAFTSAAFSFITNTNIHTENGPVGLAYWLLWITPFGADCKSLNGSYTVGDLPFVRSIPIIGSIPLVMDFPFFNPLWLPQLPVWLVTYIIRVLRLSDYTFIVPESMVIDPGDCIGVTEPCIPLTASCPCSPIFENCGERLGFVSPIHTAYYFIDRWMPGVASLSVTKLFASLTLTRPILDRFAGAQYFSDRNDYDYCFVVTLPGFVWMFIVAPFALILLAYVVSLLVHLLEFVVGLLVSGIRIIMVTAEADADGGVIDDGDWADDDDDGDARDEERGVVGQQISASDSDDDDRGSGGSPSEDEERRGGGGARRRHRGSGRGRPSGATIRSILGTVPPADRPGGTGTE
jgi:hypothetical protein